MTLQKKYTQILQRAAALSAKCWRRFVLFETSSALSDELKGYWAAYGGWKAVIKSPAVLASLVISLLSFPYWKCGTWPELSTSIVPNLLGFTLGAMAVVLAFPSTKIFKIIVEDGARDSYYIDLSSKFVHFIFVHVISIILAILGKSYTVIPLSFVGFFFLCYAVLCAAMTGLALFGVAQIFNHPAAAALLDDEHKKSNGLN
jgi:hypothetical protein